MKLIMGATPEEFAAGRGLTLYEDPRQMIEKERLEAVVISGPHSRLVDYCEVAAEAGCHFYVAKPMCTNLPDADRIVKAARQSKVIATSGMTERFDAGIREAKRLVDAGEIGRVLSVRALHQHGHYTFHEADWWGEVEEGGPELSLIWYAADCARWFAGSEVLRVAAEYDNFISPQSPFMDNGKVLMRFADGKLGSLDIYFSVSFKFPNWEIEVMGTEGAIRTQQSAFEGMLFTKDGPRVFQRTQNDLLREEVGDWLAACQEGRDPLVKIEDCRQVMEICCACREAAREKRVVELPLG
jgi:myo-inositol 2-dehydrogenase/D-chiro-inositol 1-dehydrogenase